MENYEKELFGKLQNKLKEIEILARNERLKPDKEKVVKIQYQKLLSRKKSSLASKIVNESDKQTKCDHIIKN